MTQLEGRSLAAELKLKQTERVSGLKSKGINPKLAILLTKDDPVIDTYVQLKKAYGEDIGAGVSIEKVPQAELPALIQKLNMDPSVHGIIIQLPLADPAATEEIVNLVKTSKDVDGLGEKAEFAPATPKAILALLDFHNIDLSSKQILLIGRGKLVGAPLEAMLKKRDLNVTTVAEPTPDLSRLALESEVIIAATGSPAVLTNNMVKDGAVIIDAGLASEKGRLVGDADESLHNRENISITPTKGGIGPLTVSMLFDNLLQAAENQI